MPSQIISGQTNVTSLFQPGNIQTTLFDIADNKTSISTPDIISTRLQPSEVVNTLINAPAPIQTTLALGGTSSDNVAAAPAKNSFGQAVALAAGATATLATVLSAPAGFKLKGVIATGNGDAYVFVQINSITVLSGRTKWTVPTLELILPNGVEVATGATVAIKVTNECGSIADYEATLLGE